MFKTFTNWVQGKDLKYLCKLRKISIHEAEIIIIKRELLVAFPIILLLGFLISFH